MKIHGNQHSGSDVITTTHVSRWTLARRRLLSPTASAAFRALTGHTGRRWAALCGILLGLVIQAAMIMTAAYLIDLCISLMELWAELARKHLEITLS